MTSKPKFVPFWMGQEACLHHAFLSMMGTLLPPFHFSFRFSFPTLVSSKVLLGREDRMVG